MRHIPLLLASLTPVGPVLATPTDTASAQAGTQQAATAQAASMPTTPTVEEIEAAQFTGAPLADGQSALTVRVQVLLDRAGISPGIIDGYKGAMSESAIRAYEHREGLMVDGLLDEEVWIGLGGSMATGITMTYVITPEDTQITPDLPDDYSGKAQLDWLGFEHVAEGIAERFHMDEDFLRDLNPDATFTQGEAITVVDPGPSLEEEVARIEISERRLRAYDGQGGVVASYPVAVGSRTLPSPSGLHRVDAVAVEPNYTYRPDVNFQQDDNTEPLILPPGPNGPVGLVWIDLSKPTYGIHGTASPAKLYEEASHGCVRMTNWDARELAHMVDTGIEVEFVE